MLGNEIITRHRRVEGQKFWFTANSSYSGHSFLGWQNCLYLHFFKEDFPFIESPPLVDCAWMRRNKRFDYYQSVLAELSWHGGITFYQETTDAEYGRTMVKVGCDYQHYMDEAYQAQDFGAELLESDAVVLEKEFIALCRRLNIKLLEAPSADT